jgi:Zn-dependent alcohol dehydrogenase
MALQVSGIEEEITIDMNLFEWDKVYMNPLYGKCNPPVDFPRLFELYKKRRVAVGRIGLKNLLIGKPQRRY